MPRVKATASCLLVFITLSVSACGGGGDGGGGDVQPGISVFFQEEWLIPTTQVVDGGPGKDGIPALEAPVFEAASTIATAEPNDLVIMVRDGNQVRAYPHDIMDYHEIVNDGSADDPFSVSYCPLTGSAVAWKGRASDSDPTFGVSGFLYNSNLLLYDRETDSYWSQMLQVSVTGPRIRQRPDNVQVIETTFATLVDMFPDAIVMTRNTGHFRNYDNYPYRGYRSEPDILFPVSRQDNRLPSKERAIGIHGDDSAKVYQLDGFGESTRTINDQFQDEPIVVLGNSAFDFAAIYSRELSDGTILTFDALQGDLPHVMVDTEGNVWDIFGVAVSGPRQGEQLARVRSYTAMWFAWASHFENVEIHFN